MRTHLDRTYLARYQRAVEIGVGAACLGVELEGNLYLRHQLLQALAVYAAVGTEESRTEGIEGHGTIHGARIDIDITYLASQVFGHGTLATRRVSVDGYHNFLHIYNIIMYKLH